MQYGPEEQSPDLSGVVGLTGEEEILVLPDPAENFELGNSDPKDEPPPQTSTLIEFPGVVRRSEPPWRKELSRRVREVQERRAKEAAEEPAAIQNLAPPSPDPVLTQLELVPQLPTPAMNQLVENALRRVERGRNTDVHSSSQAAVSAAGIEDPESMPEAPRSKGRSLKKRGLSVVPSSTTEDHKSPAKPVRPIEEDAVLSYLDSHFPLAVPVDARTHRAGYGRRIASASFDSFFMALLAAPFAAGIELADGNWSDPRIQGLMIAAALAVMVLYLTIFTALKGQTWGMRILSIRAIDIRTGFAPTGGQSIMRALACVLSIATLGFGLAYALIDPDKRTLPDRFSKTVIVRE